MCLDPWLHMNGERSHCDVAHWIVNVYFKAKQFTSQSGHEVLVDFKM